ncbi:MAG: FecR domain-containing protein, partial [Elusimicrobia bacterium]|nr:FecR domain-containing protein [Elusimicrobiota bacterium]
MATLGLLLALVLPSVPVSAAAGAAVAGGGLVYASGPVTVEDASGPHKAVVNEPLRDGDSVVTGAGATAVIRLIDGSKLKLKETSRIKLSFPKGREQTTDVLLGLGGVFAKVAKRAPGAEFRVRTPTAVAAVRGTRFFTAYGRAAGGARDLWVCVDEGLVDVGTDAAK